MSANRGRRLVEKQRVRYAAVHDVRGNGLGDGVDSIKGFLDIVGRRKQARRGLDFMLAESSFERVCARQQLQASYQLKSDSIGGIWYLAFCPTAGQMVRTWSSTLSIQAVAI